MRDVRKNTPGKKTPKKVPRENYPLEICPKENCLPGKLPPPPKNAPRTIAPSLSQKFVLLDFCCF